MSPGPSVVRLRCGPSLKDIACLHFRYIIIYIYYIFLILLIIKVTPVSSNIRHETEFQLPQSLSAPQEKQEQPDSEDARRVFSAQTRSKTFQKSRLQSSRVVDKVQKYKRNKTQNAKG